MANKFEIVIRGTATRGATNLEYTTKGRYVSTPVNGLSNNMPRQAILPTATTPGFWEAVLALVNADITAGG